MGIFGKKQTFNKEGIKEKLGEMPLPKGSIPSGFGGKPFLKREKFRDWLKKEESWRITKLSQKERVELEKKLFDPKRFGQLIDPKEVKQVYKEIKFFQKKSKEKYGIKTESERLKILKLLENFFGEISS